MGFLDLDLPCDIRDIIADVRNLAKADDIKWDMIAMLALDLIGVIPVIGALKYSDEIGTLFKSADKVSVVTRSRVTDLNAPTHQGIDGVYYNLDGHPPYIIGEAKYGSSRLAILADGTPQMSDKWIIDRLENAVGEGVANDIKMEMILNPDNVGSILVHVSSNGEIDITKLIDGIKQ